MLINGRTSHGQIHIKINMDKKKIIIIGAGISGMTAGIYALDNGYDVTIYEKHKIVGGQCTGWNRSGVFIDGCAHWIVGTNPSSELYPLWIHTGAFTKDTIVHQTEYFSKYDINGEIFTLYADLNKLKEEMLRIAPEDKRMIKRFTRAIKTYQKVKIPTKKPIDKMNIFELIKFGFGMLPILPKLLVYMHMSIDKFSKKFKSPIIREGLRRVMNPVYNVHSLLYIMQTLSRKDAGVLKGGSREFSFNIADKFKEKGGVIYTSSEVKKILIENNKAIGVEFLDGKKEYSDYVIASSDAHHTITDLLGEKYKDKYYNVRFNDREKNPLSTSVLIAYKITSDFTDKPKMMNFGIEPIKLGSMTIDNITVRNHSFDSSLNKDASTLTVLIDTTDLIFDFFKGMDKKTYYFHKMRFGEAIRQEIIKYFDIEDESIKLIDVATPLTYSRYTNAYRGSYMSFITTKNVKGLMRVGLIKGLKNFVLAGQWLMPPGGLPIALFTGKHAAYRVCNMDKKKFIDLDER